MRNHRSSEEKAAMTTKHDELMLDPEFRKHYAIEGFIGDTAELIWQLLVRRDMKQADLARRLNKTPAFVSQLLNGKANMTIRTLAEVVYALGATVKIDAQDENTSSCEAVDDPQMKIYRIQMPAHDASQYFRWKKSEMVHMNAYMIFQTKEETDLAVAVNRNAQISDMRLARAKVSADCPGTALPAPITVSMGVKAKQVEGPTTQLLIEVSFRLTGSKKEDTSKNRTIVSVECTFEVSYQLHPEFTPSAEQIKAFKDGNAIFNCWPYCRQYVQDMIQRMGYPPLILPLLRVQTKHRESRKLSKPE
jgi:transcriptional regulator with XRE-family HTH domain/preprotein translocase subunit SecB